MWKFPLYEVGQPIDWDLIESTYDWVSDMRDVPQDTIWHQEGDVFIHTKMVVEALIGLSEFIGLTEENKHIVFTAALMHDIEKRSTTTHEIEDGLDRIRSHKHSQRGESTIRGILYKEIDTPFETREHIAKLVRLHSLPLWAIEKEDPNKAVIRASLDVNTFLLAMLAKADILGRIANDNDDMLYRVELFKELCKDNRCFGNEREFNAPLDRYTYLNRKGFAPATEFFDARKFTVYVIAGLPGTGKDYFIQQELSDLHVLSLDDIRREHKIKPTDKKGNGRVIQMGKEKAKELMREKLNFVYNATNITRDMRSKWISLFQEYGGYVKIIYLEVPYKKLLSQNKNREYPVPEDVIEKLIYKLDIPSCAEAPEIIFQIK